MYSPFNKITYVALCLFGTASQRYLMCCLLGYSPHFCPPKNFLLSCCAFLKVNTVTLFFMHSVGSDQSLSHVRLFATPWIAACQASLSITNSWSSLKLIPIKSGCHPTISSSVIPFSSCPQSLPASGSFPMSQLFAWGDRSIGVSALAWVHPMNTQDLSPLGWTGWISPCSPRGSQESSPTPKFKSVNFSVLSFLHSPTLTSIHDHWKNHSRD